MHLLKASAFRNLFNLNSTIPVSLNLLLKRCQKAGACWTFDLQSQIGRHDIFFQVGAERATMLQGVMRVHKMSGHSDYVQRGSASLRLWCGSDVETCPPAVVRWVGGGYSALYSTHLDGSVVKCFWQLVINRFSPWGSSQMRIVKAQETWCIRLNATNKEQKHEQCIKNEQESNTWQHGYRKHLH